MILSRQQFITSLQGLSTEWLPFADAACETLSMRRLLRLALFQVSVGMSVVLLSGTLNRVMVVELGQAAWLVSLMVAIPLLLAPARALVGYRSDHHRSYLGWRRVPYLWFGTIMQFGGLSIMPFALIVMTEPHSGPALTGPIAAMLAFSLVGIGMHTTQTAGLALATDLASEDTRPKVVALLYTMLLVGTIVASGVFSVLLEDFNYVRLIKVLQGAAMVTAILNFIALWKQEPRRPELTRHDRERPPFVEVWREFAAAGSSQRLLVAVVLGTMGFSMQDILLEPYGAEVLGLTVAQTTALTAIWSGGMLIAFLLAARAMGQGRDPIRIAAVGGVVGIFAFAAVLLAGPAEWPGLFRFGVAGIGFGAGLFAVGTLASVMELGAKTAVGLALGAWGTAQAAATGIAIFAGGAFKDMFSVFIANSPALNAWDHPVAPYGAVYHIEILLLFAALVALGPLVRGPQAIQQAKAQFGLADFPN